MTTLIVLLCIMSYGFVGNTTGLAIHRKMVQSNHGHRYKTGVIPYLAGIFWPLVIPSIHVFKSSEYVLDKLEDKKKQKQLAKATVRKTK